MADVKDLYEGSLAKWRDIRQFLKMEGDELEFKEGLRRMELYCSFCDDTRSKNQKGEPVNLNDCNKCKINYSICDFRDDGGNSLVSHLLDFTEELITFQDCTGEEVEYIRDCVEGIIDALEGELGKEAVADEDIKMRLKLEE